MCGILGTINQPFDDTLLDLIKHRGPDGSGLIHLDVGRSAVTLGHRRLAIVDLSPAGNQPMLDASGRYSIIFNGEIYNHLDLRQRIDHVIFNGHSDTETILHWLARNDIGAVRDLNGIFSFGFVDKGAGKLYLVRDPFGVKPLYYYHDGNRLVFASELKPIQKLVGDTIDPEKIAELLRLRYSPSPDTLFRKIQKVRPGHILEVDLLDPALPLREFPYIQPAASPLAISFDAAVDQYGALFEAAVKRQLMSDVEVGMLLSGGIDSALVAAFARNHSAYRLKAFTVGFNDQDDSDEIAAAAETAATLNLEHHTTRIGFDDFLATVRKCIGIVEEPVATTSVIPMFYLSELAARHVKVVLSGQGADEPLGGYGRYQGELWREMIPAGLAGFMQPIATAAGLRNEQLLRGLRALSEKDDIERFVCTYEVFDRDEINRLIGVREHRSVERVHYSYDLLACAKRKRSVERMMSIDLRMNLSDDLLLYTDKITMHHSLECRVPILDLDLIRFVESLPADYRVRLGKGKIVHKRFAQGILPGSIINRQKKGFQSPTKTWFRKETVLRDILLDPTSRFASVFNLKEVENVLRAHANGYNRERHIFLLLSLNYWMAEYA